MIQGFVPFELPFTEIEVLQGGQLEGGALSYKTASLTLLTIVLFLLSVVAGDASIRRTRVQVPTADVLAISEQATLVTRNNQYGIDPDTGL